LRRGYVSKVLFISAVAILVAVLVIASGVLFPQKGVTVVAEATLPDVPGEMEVLKTAPWDMDEKRALNVAAEVFEVNGTASKPEFINDTWRIVEGTREVWVHKCGAIKYFDNSKMWGRTLLKEPPALNACIAAAEQLLEKLKANGLMPEGLNISFSDVANDTMIFAFKNGTISTYLNNVHVNFALSYKGVPLWGPGAKVRVYFGEEAEIIGFIGNLWNVKAVEAVHTLTPNEALEKLKEIGFGDGIPDSVVSEAIVKSVELVYFAPSPEAESTHIIPAYHIKGMLICRDGGTVNFEQTVPAVPLR